MAKRAIQCSDLTKRFGPIVAVDGVTLEVEEGETLALLGPSGCGKTTLLRLIAGFERPDAGRIAIHERSVVGPGTWVPPDRRHIGFVFQDYALFPHLSVGRNIAFGLKDRAKKRARVKEMLNLIGFVESQADRMPHELSGGQQQRVALARALAPDPDLVLLDEPFSNLDASLRLQMRQEVDRILKAAGATAVFVTHDQEEALNLGSTVAVMSRGRILEVATPRGIYLDPQSREAAEIAGSVNTLRGESTGVTIKCALGQLPLARPCRTGPMDVLLRPESIELKPAVGEDDGRDAEGTIRRLDFHGSHLHVLVALAGGEKLRVQVDPGRRFQIGQRVSVSVPGPVIGLTREEGADS